MSLASVLSRCPVPPRVVAAPAQAEDLSHRARSSRRQAGFTLIELMVTMVIASTLMSIGAFGFTNWRHTSQQRGTAQELVSALRSTAVPTSWWAVLRTRVQCTSRPWVRSWS